MLVMSFAKEFPKIFAQKPKLTQQKKSKLELINELSY